MIAAVCVDPLNSAGRPTPANLKTYGFGGVRSVFRDHPDWFSYHNAVKRVELASIVTLARESFGSASTSDTISGLPIDADMVVIGNEPDGEPPSSWVMSPAEFRTLLRDCAPLIRRYCPTASVVAGGLVSGQPSWLEPIADDLAGLVDAVDIHPYAKNAVEAANLLEQYQFVLGDMDLAVLEWYRLAEQIRDFLVMLQNWTEASAFFCWSDGMVPGFGLVDHNGNPKPEIHAMLNALPAQAPPPPSGGEFVLGFKKWHDAEPGLLGDPIKSERGGIPGFSVQKTSRGRLMAQYLASPLNQQIIGWTLTFWDDATDNRYLWSDALGRSSVISGG